MITGLKGSSHNFGYFKNKNCSHCGEEFTPYHPRQKLCSRECQRIISRKSTRDWELNNPDKFLDSKLRSRYGITVKDYSNMYEKQNGKCAICDNSHDKLDVDHCHETGVVRGLLCGVCNRALGMFGDNIKGLMKAIKYLRKEYGT